MAGYKFTVKLDIDNIGPHYGERKLAFADEVDSNKAIIFATNGTGKSFISRAFRLTSNEKRAELADDLLTLGQKFGNLSFSVINNDNVKQLSISLERGKIPVIKDSTGLVFHVFNSDYIEENIKQNHYTLDGNIQGYILGKAQIDLTEEREREKILEREHASSSETIDIEIEQARKQLREKRVLPTTTEFGLIEKNRLLGTEDFENIASFEEIVAQLDTLSKVPDVLPDVQAPSLNVDSTALYEAGALLTTEFPKTEWDEEFVTDIKANRTFIESGLVQLNDRNTCPFCKQPLQADALRLLKNYKAYLVDKEAETLRSIEACIKSIEDIIEDFEKVYSSTKVAIADIDGLKEYFPSLADVKLEISGVGEEATREFKSIIELLEEKSSDLDKVHPE
ncbi:MAG TPA: AAA family ATPase, partial [Saccharofermentans sp.]|nr:AAA family ATPase [Saccharofermentans sp.]